MKSVGHATLRMSCYVCGKVLEPSNLFTSEGDQLAGLTLYGRHPFLTFDFALLGL